MNKGCSTQPGCYEQMIGKRAIINLLLERHRFLNCSQMTSDTSRMKGLIFLPGSSCAEHFILLLLPRNHCSLRGIWTPWRNRGAYVKAVAFLDNIWEGCFYPLFGTSFFLFFFFLSSFIGFIKMDKLLCQIIVVFMAFITFRSVQSI